MNRGDIVAVAIQRDYGKPRPAVIVQSNLLLDIAPSVVVCPCTSEIVDAHSIRVLLEPTPETGLRVRTQVMVDKIQTVPVRRIGELIGRLDARAQEELDQKLILLLGLID